MGRLISPDIDRLVIEMPSWIGDTVMATPVLRAARTACPRARIVVIVRPGLDAILQGLPHVDEIVTASSRGVIGVYRAARAIRKAQPDAVLLLPNSFRSGLGAWLSRAAVRVGYARDSRSVLLTQAVKTPQADGPVAAITYYARLAEAAFGLESIDMALELVVSDSERAAAKHLLGDEPGTRWVLLNPGANRPDKRWPADRFASVGNHLSHAHGVRIAVTGSPVEGGVVADVVARIEGDAINLVERGVTLSSLKGVIDRAVLLITNDTGPRHIAAALGTPTVALFGPTDHRWTTLPGAPERVLLAAPFLPEKFIADQQRKACDIARIAVGDVIAAAAGLLDDQGTQTAGAPHE